MPNDYSRNPEIVYRCRSEDEAKDLIDCVQELFPDLEFKLQMSNLDVYARQGPLQSIHEYLDERKQVQTYLQRLTKNDPRYKAKAYELAQLILKQLSTELSENHPLQTDLKHRQDLLRELRSLDNDPGFWILCRQILNLEQEQKEQS